MIASYLGITPESLSRVRKELARKTLFRIINKKAGRWRRGRSSVNNRTLVIV
jgi:hypothetical protein